MTDMEEPKIIKGTLNCSAINKERLFKKDGKPGQYLRIVLIKKKELDKYGQVAYMIKEDVTKEQREAGLEGGFIGDATIPKPKDAAPTTRRQQEPMHRPPGKDDDVPF